jgi:two-component system sensor histidine kinase HydH
MNSPGEKVGLKIASILGCILGITLLHYSIGVSPLNHQIYGKFYYGPVIMAALWFGIRGGVLTSAFTSLLLIPHLFIDWGNNMGGLWGIFLEVPILNLAGLVTGYLRDKEREERAALAKVSHFVSLGRTYSFAAHEMKNIGTSICGFTRLIHKRANLSEDAKGFLDVIEKESLRMERLAKGMLHFSRDSTLKKEKLDINAFLKDIISISQHMANEKGISFYSDVTENLPEIWLDPDRMKEVLINLTQNAIHATPRGGIVILRALGNHAKVKIQIADTGNGIPRGDLDKIFQPYFTRKTDGTGLGLAVSKKIVEAHGASIEVDSKEGMGTQFSIIFPNV